MKISITNNIALNGGDAAILYGMVKVLKDKYGKDAEIHVFGSNPDVCQRLYPQFLWHETLGVLVTNTKYASIRYIGRIARIIKQNFYFSISRLIRCKLNFFKCFLPKKEREIITLYQNSDLIVSSGGTYLIEPYGINSQYTDYIISTNLKKPLIQYTQSMGPFYRKATIEKMREIITRSKLVLCRDEQTKLNIEKLGDLNFPPLKVVSDAAFALGDPKVIRSRNKDTIPQKYKIGISVRDWASIPNMDYNMAMNKYRDSIASVATHFAEKGYDVYFYSTCQGLDDYDNDNKQVELIVKSIPKFYLENIHTFDKHLTLSEIMNLHKSMDFVIATRLHMSILALICGTPVYPIAYEFKNVELFKSLGYEDIEYMWDIEPEKTISNIESFIDTYTQERREQINEQVILYIKDALGVSSYLPEIR